METSRGLLPKARRLVTASATILRTLSSVSLKKLNNLLIHAIYMFVLIPTQLLIPMEKLLDFKDH
jgi:hypothetical protein